jgi:hypothetical protein
MDGTDGPLGPSMRIVPGHTINVWIVNNLDDGMELFQQHRAKVLEYWINARDPINKLHDNVTFYGRAPDVPDDMTIVNKQDLPPGFGRYIR